MSRPAKKRPIIGWREWASLPEFGVSKIKVKVDTGARTSALHVTDIERVTVGRHEYVEFKLHPKQHSRKPVKRCRARLIDERRVTSSTGVATIRPVIEVMLKIGEFSWPIEITLINRDIMSFRMLLGRQALKGQFLVSPSRSFLIGKSPGGKHLVPAPKKSTSS